MPMRRHTLVAQCPKGLTKSLLWLIVTSSSLSSLLRLAGVEIQLQRHLGRECLRGIARGAMTSRKRTDGWPRPCVGSLQSVNVFHQLGKIWIAKCWLWISTYLRIHVHLPVHIRICMYIYIYIYIYIQIQKRSLVSPHFCMSFVYSVSVNEQSRSSGLFWPNLSGPAGRPRLEFQGRSQVRGPRLGVRRPYLTPPGLWHQARGPRFGVSGSGSQLRQSSIFINRYLHREPSLV